MAHLLFLNKKVLSILRTITGNGIKSKISADITLNIGPKFSSFYNYENLIY
jgi:hypothetical protein